MEGKDWVELLKFPITILVGIGAIVGASYILDIRPTDVAIGQLKVKLETEIRQDIIKSNLNLEEVVREQVRLELGQLNSSDTSMFAMRDPAASATDSTTTMALNTISDDLAKIAKVKTQSGSSETVFKSTEGYIWVGNYLPGTKKFTNIKINADNLSEIKVGEKYYVNGNMVIRENSPVQNINYYKGEKKKGVAVKGTEIKILEKPDVKKLGGYHQYWVKIEVLG